MAHPLPPAAVPTADPSTLNSHSAAVANGSHLLDADCSSAAKRCRLSSGSDHGYSSAAAAMGAAAALPALGGLQLGGWGAPTGVAMSAFAPSLSPMFVQQLLQQQLQAGRQMEAQASQQQGGIALAQAQAAALLAAALQQQSSLPVCSPPSVASAAAVPSAPLSSSSSANTGAGAGVDTASPITTTTRSASAVSSSQLDASAVIHQQHHHQQLNTVLRVIIDHMLYPVTLDVLHTIFSRYGKVLRIITFNKNNTFQALVQLSEAGAALNARAGLDGQNVYNGCCTLRVDYSKLATLNVKYNNDKSRDYTNPNLPSGELSLEQQISLVSAAAAQGQLNVHSLGMLAPNAFASLSAGGGGQISPAATSFYPSAAATGAGNVQSATQGQQQQAGVQHGSNDLLASSGVVSAPHHHQLHHQFASPLSLGSSFSPFTAGGLNPFLAGLTAGNLSLAGSALMGGGGSAMAAAAALHFQQQLGAMMMCTTPVVLVSNLDEAKVTPDALFTLFGVYGDVQRVKILFNKKDNALVQYAEPQQAQLAIQNLDKVRWHGKAMRVTSSKHTNVQMPKEGQPDAGLTRDYTNSPLHRFKKPGSKNYLNIYAPSATLHLSNIPPSVTDAFMRSAFQQKGFPLRDFQFFQRDHKMALAQLEEVEQAVEALVEMHNFKLADNAHLRVSFAKKGPGSGPAGQRGE